MIILEPKEVFEKHNKEKFTKDYFSIHRYKYDNIIDEIVIDIHKITIPLGELVRLNPNILS